MEIIELKKSNNYNKQISKLYKDIYNITFEIEAFREWYSNNPLGLVKEFISVINTKIVAYNYFFPQHWGNKKVFLSGGSMVNKKYKGAFIHFFGELIKLFDKKVLLYGFPNKNAYPLHLHKFGFNWHENTEYKIVKLLSSKEVKKTNRFNECDINLISVNSKQLSSLGRNISWIKWRLKKPKTKYSIIEKENKYIIYKIYNSSVDLLTILNCESIDGYIKLLVDFYSYIISKGFKSVSLISTNVEFYQKLCNYFNIKIDNYERHLCYKSLLPDTTINNKDMFFEMIDSDVF